MAESLVDNWRDSASERNQIANRNMFATPRVAIQFLNTLVGAVSSNWHLNRGFQIVPEGVLGGDSQNPRTIFLEDEILNSEEVQLERIDLADLRQRPLKSMDLIVGTLHLFGQPSARNRPDEVVTRLIECAQRISSEGVGIFLTPTYYRTFRLGLLAEALEGEGIFVHGVVNTPPRFLLGQTSLQPLFVIISRQKPQSIFALDCRSIEDLVLNIAGSLSHVDTGDLRTGIEVDLSIFQGFEHWYAQREIDSLEGDYTRYEKFRIQDVSLFVNLTRTGEEFEEIPNSVYLPMIGNGLAVDAMYKTSMKHQNYAQIVVDTLKATPEFLCSFMNTRHFRLYLEAEKLTKNQVIPKLNREQVRFLPVALPNLEIQQKISRNIAKLSELRSMVDELAQNMSINPVSSTSMTQQVDEALAVFGRLSAEDHVVSLLRQGESKTVEFKQTLSLDIADNTKKRFLEDMVIKTVGAFLNSDGGDLLVGVNDEGQVTGIDLEIEKLHKGSRDNFLKHFKNCLKTRIGEQSYPRVRYDIVEVAEKCIFRVTCQPSDIAVFVDGDAFYVRTNPATDKIVGQVFLDYVEQRFKRNPPAVLG